MEEAKINEFFNVILHAPAQAVREYMSQPGMNVEIQNDKGDTALLLAARRGDLDVVQTLLDPPILANVHTRNLKGSNALIAAAMKGHTDICRLLLKHGADINQSTDSNDTALSLAIWQNHTEVCLLLIQSGANVDNIDKFGDGQLLDAAKHGNVAVMQLLLEKQTLPIDHQNKKGDSALLRAAWKGELAALTLLLDHGASPSITNKTGCTPLIMAAIHNNRACVKRLIERETSPINAVDDSGRSAFAYLGLFAPAPNGPPEDPYWAGMEMLLERNCRIDTPVNMGNLLLCRAANINQIRLADLLLKAGADINFCDPANKERPALLAHLQGAPDLNCTKFLVANNARVDYQDTDGHTGLMFAIKHNSPEIAGFLLESGASTMLENKNGETAATMCMAMMHNFQTHINQLTILLQADPDHPPTTLALHQLSLERAQKCLQLLTERSALEMGSGALLLQAAQHGELAKIEEYLTIGVKENDVMQAIDVNFTDKQGRSSLMLAAKSNHVHCVKYLLQHGALLNLRDKDGLTALTLAIRSNSRDCAELLAETIQGASLSRGAAYHFFQNIHQAQLQANLAAAAANGGTSNAQGCSTVTLSGMSGHRASITSASAQVFGLSATPQQMAQEEFDASTNFLLQVNEQLRLYLTKGKAAALEAQLIKPINNASSSSSTINTTTNTLTNLTPSTTIPIIASSPTNNLSVTVTAPAPLLPSPSSSIPRSSSSYFNSFPSPDSAPIARTDEVGLESPIEPLPAAAAASTTVTSSNLNDSTSSALSDSSNPTTQSSSTTNSIPTSPASDSSISTISSHATTVTSSPTNVP